MPYLIRKGGSTNVNVILERPFIEHLELLAPDGQALPAATGDETVNVPFLGDGGFGVVIRARDELGMHRAVKVLGGQTSQLGDSETAILVDEIRRSSEVPKKHTVPVVRFGRPVDDAGKKYAFYAMPFLEGTNVMRFLRELRIANSLSEYSARDVRVRSRNILLRVLRDVTAGIEELALESMVHMDISTSNIHVTSRGAAYTDLRSLERRVAAFLLDFGAARTYTTHEAETTLTPFVRNEAYFPTRLLNDPTLICSRGGGNATWMIDSRKLGEYGDRIDLACFARVVENVCFNLVRRGRLDSGSPEFLRDQSAKEAAWRGALGQDFDFLEDVIDRLLRVDVPYKRAHEVREMFESMLPSRSASPFDSLLLTDRYKGTRLRVATRLVNIAPPMDEVIDHPSVQNLKRVRQLSFLDQLYPGGTHSRFVHSVMVFDLGKRVVRSLARRSEFRLEFSGRKVDEFLAACLLHDIGHYPFSHTIEDLRKEGDLAESQIDEDLPLETQKRLRDRIHPLKEILHDHELSVRLLYEPCENWKRSPHSIARLLEEDELSPDGVQYMITKGRPDPARPVYQQLGRQLVAGIIDVDRIAYLTLDSRETGVSFGRAVDVDSLVESLRVRCDPPNIGLGVEELGISAVEAVLAATHWMYRHVYWHRQNRAFMAAAKFVFRQLLESGSTDFNAYLAAVRGKDDYFALRWISSRFDKLVQAHGGNLHNPLGPVERGGRLPYARVFSLGRRSPRFREDRTGDPELYEHLASSWTPWREDAVLDALHMAIPGGDMLRRGEILVDVPLKPRFRQKATGTEASGDPQDLEPRRIGLAPATAAEIGERSVQLWAQLRHQTVPTDVVWLPLHTVSPLAGPIAETEDGQVRLIRVFLPRPHLERLAPRERRELPTIVSDCLRQVTKD